MSKKTHKVFIDPKQAVKQRFSNNFYYFNGMDTSYDTDHPCDGGCNNDYCRCGVIENVKFKITDLSEAIRGVIDAISGKRNGSSGLDFPLNEISMYGIKKILLHHRFNDEYKYDPKVGGGYYGQELDAITFDGYEDVIRDIACLLSLNTNEAKMEFLLTMEYGHVPEHLRGLDWEVDFVDIDKIKYEQHVMSNATADNNEKEYPLKLKDGLEVICLDNTNFLRLVDGYHRLSIQLAEKTAKVKVIKGRKP